MGPAYRGWSRKTAGHPAMDDLRGPDVGWKRVSVTRGADAGSQQPARRHTSRGLWIWAALGALVGAVVGGLIAAAFWSGPDVTSAACTASSVADQVVPSVVTIEVGRSSPGHRRRGPASSTKEGDTS
jgi:hypothetical protein